MSRTSRILLSLAVAVVLLGLLFAWGDVAPEELWATLRGLPPETYFLALPVHASIYLVRALRFRALVPPGARPGYGGTLAASAAHNLAAYVLPAKTGEASLVLYLKRLCAVPGPEGTASLLVSRILDLAVLCGAMATACLLLGGLQVWMVPLGIGLGGLSLLLLVLSARSHLFVRLAVLLSRAVGLSRTGFGRRLQATVDRVAAALDEAGRGGRLAGAIALSVPIWLGVFLFYAILVRGMGLGDELALPRATFGSGLAVLANLLPVNGLAGFGTQETGWVIGFGALGVPRDLALSSGVGVHLIQLLNVCIFGLLGHLAMGWLPAAGGREASSREAG